MEGSAPEASITASAPDGRSTSFLRRAAFSSAGKVDVKSLITGTVEFGDAEAAFKSVKEGKGIKVLIKGPNEK